LKEIDGDDAQKFVQIISQDFVDEEELSEYAVDADTMYVFRDENTNKVTHSMSVFEYCINSRFNSAFKYLSTQNPSEKFDTPRKCYAASLDIKDLIELLPLPFANMLTFAEMAVLYKNLELLVWMTQRNPSIVLRPRILNFAFYSIHKLKVDSVHEAMNTMKLVDTSVEAKEGAETPVTNKIVNYILRMCTIGVDSEAGSSKPVPQPITLAIALNTPIVFLNLLDKQYGDINLYVANDAKCWLCAPLLTAMKYKRIWAFKKLLEDPRIDPNAYWGPFSEDGETFRVPPCIYLVQRWKSHDQAKSEIYYLDLLLQNEKLDITQVIRIDEPSGEKWNGMTLLYTLVVLGYYYPVLKVLRHPDASAALDIRFGTKMTVLDACFKCISEYVGTLADSVAGYDYSAWSYLERTKIATDLLRAGAQMTSESGNRIGQILISNVYENVIYPPHEDHFDLCFMTVIKNTTHEVQLRDFLKHVPKTQKRYDSVPAEYRRNAHHMFVYAFISTIIFRIAEVHKLGVYVEQILGIFEENKDRDPKDIAKEKIAVKFQTILKNTSHHESAAFARIIVTVQRIGWITEPIKNLPLEIAQAINSIREEHDRSIDRSIALDEDASLASGSGSGGSAAAAATARPPQISPPDSESDVGQGSESSSPQTKLTSEAEPEAEPETEAEADAPTTEAEVAELVSDSAASSEEVAEQTKESEPETPAQQNQPSPHAFLAAERHAVMSLKSIKNKLERAEDNVRELADALAAEVAVIESEFAGREFEHGAEYVEILGDVRAALRKLDERESVRKLSALRAQLMYVADHKLALTMRLMSREAAPALAAATRARWAADALREKCDAAGPTHPAVRVLTTPNSKRKNAASPLEEMTGIIAQPRNAKSKSLQMLVAMRNADVHSGTLLTEPEVESCVVLAFLCDVFPQTQECADVFCQ